jgi:hypothetical protein
MSDKKPVGKRENICAWLTARYVIKHSVMIIGATLGYATLMELGYLFAKNMG